MDVNVIVKRKIAFKIINANNFHYNPKVNLISKKKTSTIANKMRRILVAAIVLLSVFKSNF